jgi:type IV pilus assembly protein PilV
MLKGYMNPIIRFQYPTAVDARTRREYGFSLIEVMIALLVLSIGLLGIAGLQTYSLKFNHQSYERTQATILISEMFEKILANPTAAAAGTFISGFGDTSANYATYGGCPAACATPVELATYELFLWKSALENPKILAQGKGALTRVTDPTYADAQLFDIKVQWMENDIQMTQSMQVRIK